MGQPAHTQIVTTAAREVLRPLGLRQRGRSRLWYADQGWWSVVVEFQPHGRENGTFLNVAAMWLWHEKPYESFDYTYPNNSCRIGDFARFESEQQFTPLAKELAQKAAEEVIRYRSLFPSIHAVARHLTQKTPKQIWDTYHAGIACALAGNSLEARGLFEEVATNSIQFEYGRLLAAIAREYSVDAPNTAGFRDRIKEVVLRMRDQLKMEKCSTIEFRENL